ncbi:MAG: translation elongation factor 4 [Armatimonadota bacterium]|jgi:GTP-binding protein LepA
MSKDLQKNIRNFCIIAHIDHGKSTLADRILEFTGAIEHRDMQAQVLDSMDIERERGITIKMTAVRLSYKGRDGSDYVLNLIDTPGHVDFTYEVSRSLAACEGAILVVDAVQGVEAQTLANVNLALANNLTIIPVINKIDLPAADPERIKEEIEEVLQIPADEVILASAKAGIGTEEILEAVVNRISPPQGEAEAPLRALIFDSHYDQYQGVVAYIRVVDGKIVPDMKIKMMHSGKDFEVSGVGVFKPGATPVTVLTAGDVGYMVAGIKDVTDSRVGDTITQAEKPAPKPLPGYKNPNPMVFCGLYTIDSREYPDLREALAKLQLNDAALVFEPETSAALGFGFRCGFLGLLHMEIVQERLEREFELELIATSPSVVYRVEKTDGKIIDIDNPSLLPSPNHIVKIEEPYVSATIIVPTEFLGGVLDLAQERRGTLVTMEYPSPQRVIVHYKLPLSEILMDWFDQLKSRTRGYASFDYEFLGYQESSMVKLDILLNGQPVDALSFITHKDHAYSRGRQLVEQMKKVMPRQQYEVRIQAAIGNKVIAAEHIGALRKNVIAKCYGGDISRKRKLLEKQKEGKKRMKQIGNVEVPQEAFLSILKIGGE